MRRAIGDYWLRSYQDSDVRALVKHADNPRVARYLRDHFPQPYTRAQAVAWIRHIKQRVPETVLAIATKNELIGNIGVYLQSDVYGRSAELGYWLGEAYWGRGIATMAVRAMCDIAFARSNLLRIYACVFEPNIGSSRVLEKAGFQLEGIHRQSVVKNGEVTDERLYALLRDEWSERRERELRERAATEPDLRIEP